MSKLIYNYDGPELLEDIREGDVSYDELIYLSLDRFIFIALATLAAGYLLGLTGVEQQYIDIAYVLVATYLIIRLVQVVYMVYYVETEINSDYELYYYQETYRVKQLEQKNNALFYE